MKKYTLFISLFIIVLIGSTLRLYNINWDQGYHLHPDERAIVMFTTPLQFPSTTQEFFSKESTWNPHFFAYGSFPIYLLKIVGNIASIADPIYATYDKINLIGRFMSTIFDIGTLLVIFFLAKKLFNKNIGLITSFFYAVSVLPIQLSHFYAVDTLLAFFVLLTLYQLVRLYEKPTLVKSILVGFFFGLSLATKTSALVLIASIGMAISVDFFLIFIKTPHRPHIWFPHVPKFLKRLFIDGFIIAIVTIITFIIFEPYALIDFQTFWQQQQQQRQMTYDAFTFPYTLQYVGKILYLYELKNIFWWGLGPIIASFAFLGTIYISLKYVILGSIATPESDSGQARMTKQALTIILLTFFWIYFLVVGNFAIGFMRYMLPIYPLLCLFAAVFFIRIREHLNFKLSIPNSKLVSFIFHLSSFILLLTWPIAFMHIYTQPNTRTTASQWIIQNIPFGSTISLEHWDDGLPLFGQQNYHIQTLTLYDPDTSYKWQMINTQLAQTDYIILASNRLYVPLQKLTDCKQLPPGKCYKETAEYYKKLFSGDLGFKKVAEFSVFPSFIIHNSSFIIDDSSADESFTVYDHPKIIIFKKNL